MPEWASPPVSQVQVPHMNDLQELAYTSNPVATRSQQASIPKDMATELSTVRQALDLELRSLDSLLSYLLPDSSFVTSHLLYTKIILAIGLPRHDTWRALHQRCQLAIALELLGNALQIHHQMLVETAETDIDLAGPFILIGDYYFARAAQLVTQLGNPPLLDAFAHILKMISEQLLGHKTLGKTHTFNAAAVLSTYGIRCGTHLRADVNLDADLIVQAWQRLAAKSSVVSQSEEDSLHLLLRVTPPHQHSRWQACSTQYHALLHHISSLSGSSAMVI